MRWARTRRRKSRRRASAPGDIASRCSARLRYAGSDTALEVPFADARPNAARLRARAQSAASASSTGTKPIVFEAVHAEAHGGARALRRAREADGRSRRRLTVPRAARADFLERRVARGERLSARGPRARRRESTAPRSIIEPHQTIVVEDGWRAEITAKNHVVMKRVQAAAEARGDRGRRPIR